jgi:putative transposase
MLQKSTMAMMNLSCLLHYMTQLGCTWLTLPIDAVRFLRLCLRPPMALAAQNLFLRKQLTLYQERQIKPHRPTDAARFALTWLSRWCDWRQALIVVQPETFIHWHGQGLRLFPSWKSNTRRPPIPPELQALIH